MIECKYSFTFQTYFVKRSEKDDDYPFFCDWEGRQVDCYEQTEWEDIPERAIPKLVLESALRYWSRPRLIDNEFLKGLGIDIPMSLGYYQRDEKQELGEWLSGVNIDGYTDIHSKYMGHLGLDELAGALNIYTRRCLLEHGIRGLECLKVSGGPLDGLYYIPHNSNLISLTAVEIICAQVRGSVTFEPNSKWQLLYRKGWTNLHIELESLEGSYNVSSLRKDIGHNGFKLIPNKGGEVLFKGSLEFCKRLKEAYKEGSKPFEELKKLYLSLMK